MNDANNQLFLAGLFSGLVVGVLGALLIRRQATEAPTPFGEIGLVLPRRAEQSAEHAERAASEALARARLAIDGTSL